MSVPPRACRSKSPAGAAISVKIGASLRPLAFGGSPFHPPPNPHEHVDQVVNALTILNHGISIAVRELAIQCGFLPQF
jgi:hypothetical protein